MRAMPMWRCPHCATPQQEAARCWVCKRSSTSCATCRNFRRSVAAQIGYCGLDRRRLPLRGDEMRACWEAAASSSVDPGTDTPAEPPRILRTGVRPREFVPVEIVAAAAGPATALPAAGTSEPALAVVAPGSLADADRVTLWADPERI